jgi:tetratricopeptide (TPR) repeat protein
MALESFSALQSHYPGSEEAIWAKIETARLKKKENEEQGRALLEQAIEDYKQRQKDLADQLAAATGTLQTQGFQGMQPSVSTEDLAKIDIESKIASAYSYLGYHEEALARLEEIKSQYLHEPRIYQYLNSQIEMLRAQQEPEEEIIHGATEEAGTAAAAPIGSVSP